jgi:hypothetical protein
MEYESLIYKGYEIKIVREEDGEYFPGCYVKTIWFPDIDKAKVFVDRITIPQDMSFS